VLVIHAPQMKAFRENILRDVEAEALAQWPAQDRPEAVDVRQAIARALGYGLRTRRELARFLGVGRKLGVAFDLDATREWAAEILRDPELDGKLKIAFVEDRARRGE
jgi:hypothetical protein